MTRFENKTLTFRAWWGDAYRIRAGFTRSTEHDLNTIRLGRFVIAYGVEDHG